MSGRLVSYLMGCFILYRYPTRRFARSRCPRRGAALKLDKVMTDVQTSRPRETAHCIDQSGLVDLDFINLKFFQSHQALGDHLSPMVMRTSSELLEHPSIVVHHLVNVFPGTLVENSFIVSVEFTS
jgi:hypothetical protein